jgi:polysaccharide export outer membrane protein
VAVVVRQVNGQRVTVMGEVNRPGPLPLGSNVRLMEALSAVGGFTPFADTGDIKVIRHTEHGDVEFEFDYGDFIDGDAPETNVLLMPGDVVVVPD